MTDDAEHAALDLIGAYADIRRRLQCCSAFNLDPAGSSDLNNLPCRSASHLRADQQDKCAFGSALLTETGSRPPPVPTGRK